MTINMDNKLAQNVYKEIKSNLENKLLEKNISFEYIALDVDFKEDKKALFPIGVPTVFVKQGNSEAYRINMVIILDDSTYIPFLTVKSFSLDEALIISNELTRLLVD